MDAYRVEYDWRGEMARFIVGERSVWLACMYWGGPSGRVSHIDAVWEYTDGRRVHLTQDERAHVLQRVIEHSKRHQNIALEIERG